MQIVIKINDKEYLDIKKHPGDITSYITTVHLYDAIKEGIPLPKGYEKIIDAAFALEAKITKDNNGVSERTKGWNEACQAIYENAPTIIEADKAESEEKNGSDNK